MKPAFAAAVLAAVFITACGATSGGQAFDPGTSGTWSWNGSTWTKLSADGDSGLSLVYWKDFGGLIGWNYSLSTSPAHGHWVATRWNGADWVADDVLPGPPPNGSESLQISSLVLDEASNQLLAIDNDARTIWGWSHGAWAAVVSPTQWPNVLETRFAYDPDRRVVMILGWKGPDSREAETWAWDGRALKRLSAFILPYASSDLLSLVPDGAGHMLALGYESGFSWDGATWSSTGKGCPTSSVAIGQWGMAYDGGRRELIAIGSREDGSAGTWRWRLGKWEMMASVATPGGGHSDVAYDPELPGLVLTTFPIGGCCFFSCGPS